MRLAPWASAPFQLRMRPELRRRFFTVLDLFLVLLPLVVVVRTLAIINTLATAVNGAAEIGSDEGDWRQRWRC